MERAGLSVPLTPERVRRICDYHFGVGSDGILEVVSANGAEAEVVIWNPDGSTAELSGNGTRIAARWLARRSGKEAVRIRVGPREVAELPREEAIGALIVRTRRYAAYQRKWMRRIPGLVSVRADRPPVEVATEILGSLAGAG